MRLGVALGLLGGLVVAAAQIAWTPIFVDGSSQVDLWTQAATGCACPGEGGAECACCARDGACPCGDVAPTRCAQCGLEQHCASMCNITIDSRVLKAKSGKTFGQIKSPSLEGPGSCSYLLQPDTGQRVEIQVYRLVSVGRFNGTRCVGGWLELGGAGAAAAGAAAARLCGANERYTPPVVLFADHGASTLHFRVTERTARSQFLAYFSFTSLSNTQGVGFHPRGGSRIPNTDCDWLYQDVSCRPGGGGGAGGSGACVLASPGYPGLYPPHRRCRYLLTTNSVHTRVRIHFISILLPHNHCGTDYLTLRAGSSPAAPLLASLCTERRATLEYPGPNLLLEFNSGAQVPPFDYNGFIARLEFVERGPSSEAPATPPPSVVAPPPQPLQPLAALMDGTLTAGSNADGRWGCGTRIRSGGPGGTRSGHFDTRLSPWRSSCNIVFLGGLTDVVHISLFNYNLRSQACRSVIEVIDGIQESVGRGERAERASLRVCGPALREARDPAGRFVERQAVVSRGPNFTLVVKRASNQQPGDEEFVDGAFMFQDEQHDGTAAPDAACVTTHYGLAAPARGGVSAPAHHHLYWNHEGRLLCSHRFIPAANQSVTIEIQRLERMWSAGGGESGVGGESVGSDTCHTECGDRGCMCNTSSTLDLHDHLALLADDDTMLSCLCGDFQAAWLPVVVRSWSSVRVQYSVAHYTYASRGFDYAAAYSFNDDAVCGQRIFTTHTGEISTKNLSVTGSLNEFFYQQCTWVLDSKVERQLFIEISTKQTKPCWAWNVTVHEWAGGGGGGGGGGAGGQAGGLAAAAGEQLYTFCPRNEHVIYTLPWRLNTVVIRSVALSRQQPLYVIRWRSQVVRANTRLGPPTPAPAASRAPSPRALAALLALAALAALAALTALPT